MHNIRKSGFRLPALVFAAFLLILLAGNCGSKGDSHSGKGEMAKKADSKAGEPGQKKDEKIDVEKMDIPERMKKAIKSGRIPPERVKEMLQRYKEGGNAPLVEIERVSHKSLNSYLVLNGTVEPEKSVKVYSRLTAYVNQLKAEEGDFVKKDSVLALLDDTEINIAYQQARIQLKQAEFTYNDQEEIFKRNKELKKTDLISEQDYQTSKANFNNARLEYENKRESFKNLELQLSYTRLTSPVEGYITERLIEVGDNVTNNQHAYTVEDFNPLRIKVHVPSSDVIQLKEGMKAEVTSEILKGHVFAGAVKLINPRIDVQSGTVKVTVEVTDSTLKLKPGMFVEVKIVIGEKKDTLVIPRKSVIYKRDKVYVFVFKRGTVSQREIKIGITEEDQIEVLEGLKDDEAIVVVGVESIKDEMKVRVAR